MKIHRVRVDGQTFVLRPDQDVAVLKKKVVRAAREGAGFVKFRTVGRSTISVLITAQVGVRFESIHAAPEQVDEWEQHPPSIDLDIPEHLLDYEQVL
jgi:hypothetical protein